MPIRFVALLVLVLCLFPSIGTGGDKIIRVGLNDFPPWKYAAEDGGAKGIDVALLRAWLEPHGIEIVFTQAPFNRLLKLMEDGKLDLLSSVLRRPEREEYMAYLEPPYQRKSTKAFYLRADEAKELTRYEDLSDLRIGVLRGASYFARFDNDRKLQKFESADDPLLFQQLLAKRIDALVITENSGDYHVLTEYLGEKVAKAPYRYDKPLEVYFTLSRKSSWREERQELESSLKALIDEGEHKRMIQEYFEELAALERKR